MKISGHRTSRAADRTWFRPAPGRQARRRAPVRGAVEPLACLGRHRWAPDTDGHVQRCMKVIAREVHTALIAATRPEDMIRTASAPVQLRGQGRADAGRDRTGDRDHARPARRAPLPAQLPQRRRRPADRRAASGTTRPLLLTKMAGAPYEPAPRHGVHQVPGAGPAREEMRASIRRLSARPSRAGSRPHPADLLRRRRERESHPHRRGHDRARRLRRRRRPRPADAPGRSTPTRPASPTSSGCAWPCCTRATPATGWPRAPSSG